VATHQWTGGGKVSGWSTGGEGQRRWERRGQWGLTEVMGHRGGGGFSAGMVTFDNLWQPAMCRHPPAGCSRVEKVRGNSI
jgi:hypothetical protein